MNALESVSFPAKPWTGSQIKHLRKAMIDGQDAIDGLSYEDVSDWYMQVIGHIVNAIYEIDTTSLGIPDLRISSRVKTVGTLHDKLIRTPGMQIPNIHDIMGVRIACDMTLTEQDKLVSLLADSLPVHQILDIRISPHSGYRAVHVILKLSNGVFAEVQVRTLLQDLWANCYELAGDIFGRAIRYGGKPERDDMGLVKQLREISDVLARIESQEVNGTDTVLTKKREASIAAMKDLRGSLEQFQEYSARALI